MTEPTALAAIFERLENIGIKSDRINDRLNGVLLKQQENGQAIEKVREEISSLKDWQKNVDDQLQDLEPVKDVSNQLKKVIRYGIVLVIIFVAVQFLPQAVDMFGGAEKVIKPQ